MIFLASQSPRRQELLSQIGVSFDVLHVDVPEQRVPGEPALNYVSRVAHDKAEAGLLQVLGRAGALVIGADTEVVLDGDVFGKPADAADAAAMLQRLAGRSHQVISVVWVLAADHQARAVCECTVRFASLSSAQIADYVASGECFGKAGGYAIQGRAAAFISHLSGSYSAVMGLPLYETAQLLGAAGDLIDRRDDSGE